MEASASGTENNFDDNLFDSFGFSDFNGSFNLYDFAGFEVDECALRLSQTELFIKEYIAPVLTVAAILANIVILPALVTLATRKFAPYGHLALLAALYSLGALHTILELETYNRPMKRMRDSSPTACHVILYAESILYLSQNWLTVMFFVLVYRITTRPRHMVDYTSANLRDVLVVTCTPILALNMHYFWSFGFNQDREKSNVRPTCDLRMYQLDGQRHDPVYGYVFLNQAFIFGCFLPACVATAIAILLARRCVRRTRHPLLASRDALDINRVRRFLLCDQSALDLRRRTGPIMLACYVGCMAIYIVTFALFKILSLTRSISECTLSAIGVVHVIGQQAEVAYYCTPVIVLLITNRQFRYASDPRRLVRWLKHL